MTLTFHLVGRKRRMEKAKAMTRKKRRKRKRRKKTKEIKMLLSNGRG